MYILKFVKNNVDFYIIIPSCSYFSDNVIMEIYHKAVEKIKNLISETDYISVTSDM